MASGYHTGWHTLPPELIYLGASDGNGNVSNATMSWEARPAMFHRNVIISVTDLQKRGFQVRALMHFTGNRYSQITPNEAKRVPLLPQSVRTRLPTPRQPAGCL